MGTVQRILDLAYSEIGYLEKRNNDLNYLFDKTANAGSNNYNKFSYTIDTQYPNAMNGKKNGYSWCCMFLIYLFITIYGYDTALKMLMIPERSLAATVTYFRQYMAAFGRVGSVPHVGDIVFFGDQHVGLVTSVKMNGSSINGFTTVEGNTSGGSDTVISNGGGVFTKSYTSIKSSYQFGSPLWDLVGGYDYEEPKKESGDYELTFRLLKKGCTGDDVKALQAILTGYSYNVGIIDGDFGSKTDSAVRSYQRNHFECGSADGIVGEKTMRSLLGV